MRAILNGPGRAWILAVSSAALGFGLCLSVSSAIAGEVPEPDPEAIERGRQAVVERGFLRAQWSDKAYREVSKYWDEPAPDPDEDPEGYARAFARYYGFHPAVVPNDGLPMGLKRSIRSDGKTPGVQVDCLICHGGSIGGESIVGLPNTQIDYETFILDMFRADGRLITPIPFTLNTARGTVNAGTMSIFLFSFRNPDLSMRTIPMPVDSRLPELDTPAWWTLKYKDVMYYDGRTPADSDRAGMQFLLAEKSLEEFKKLEPVFRDVHAYLNSIEAPKYPFPIDAEKAERGRALFKRHCSECHGTYGETVEFPGEIVPLETVGTDPARLEGLSERFVKLYNASWFAEHHPVSERLDGYQAPPLVGIWASAPYLHNGSVPTLHALLNSPTRPKRFTRPPSTDFEHYDKRNVGWRFEELGPPDKDAKPPSRHKAHFIYDTSRYGLGNGGHTFGDKLSEKQRYDLIEYLKTL